MPLTLWPLWVPSELDLFRMGGRRAKEDENAPEGRNLSTVRKLFRLGRTRFGVLSSHPSQSYYRELHSPCKRRRGGKYASERDEGRKGKGRTNQNERHRQ
jgi:hypothetical protein